MAIWLSAISYVGLTCKPKEPLLKATNGQGPHIPHGKREKQRNENKKRRNEGKKEGSKEVRKEGKKHYN